MINNLSGLSNSFSTGGGGNNFENRIQAMFLLSLFVEGICPVINLKPIRLCFQAKRIGFAVDDLVVYTEHDGLKGKLLIQAKHKITATYNNHVFRSVIAAAWSDFDSEQFDKNNDIIALATAQISVNCLRALRFLHDQAIASLDSQDFKDRVELQQFSNSANEEMLSTLSQCISDTSNRDVSFDDLWQFCKAFIVILFDVDFAESVNRSLALSLIKCRSSYDAEFVWSRLVDYAAQCNQSAASITLNNVDTRFRNLFAFSRINSIEPMPISEIDMFIPTIALIGSWNDENVDDISIVELLSGVEYSVFQAKARNLIAQNSEYLEFNNGEWSVIHKEELLIQCKDYIFEDLINHTISATIKVLSEKNKRYVGNSIKRIITTREYDNSNSLRIELLRSLCIIKKHISEFNNLNREKIESSMSIFVKNLLYDADWITWASLRDCLQFLAELSPDVYLDCIESEILNNPNEIMSLFPRRENNSFLDWNLSTEILWSLEVLAWSPCYMVRTITVLGMLEGLNYEKTNWTNTPLNSIISILFPWYPQTLADFDKRKNALMCLKKDNQTVFWRVLINLLPNQTFSTMTNPRPEYLNLNIPEKIIVSRTEINNEIAFMLDLAVDVSSESFDWLLELSNQMKYMQKNTLNRYLECLSKRSESCTKDQSYYLWYRLKKELIGLSDKSSSSKLHIKISSMINSLEPKDIRIKYRVLYEEDALVFYDGITRKTLNELEQNKSAAVKEIFNMYGAVETELFGVSVNNLYDVGNRLGCTLSSNQLSLIIDECYRNNISNKFTVYCICSYINKHKSFCLNKTSLAKYHDDFLISIISKIPFDIKIYNSFKNRLCDNSTFWQEVIIPFPCGDEDNDGLVLLVEKLCEYKRYVAAVNLLGRSIIDAYDKDNVCKILIKAGTEKSFGNETIDKYAVQRIFSWLQEKEDVDLSTLSDIDFIYLPIFDDYSEVKPRALFTRLSTEPEYFCNLIELFYKKSKENKHNRRLSEPVKERLYKIIFQFKVAPGYIWNGSFDERTFKAWIEYVVDWSKENDRFKVTMQTVGSGLSYAVLDENKLPPRAIIEELNKPDNIEMRRGYYLGILNQRGVVFVDPEGKPELALSEDYNSRANYVESLGYSRYSDVLKEIADNYLKEANRHINDAKG